MSDNVHRLRIQSGPESGRTYTLDSGSITIGRYPLADIVINEPDIAYRHALLTRSGDTYRIADLGSDAGTYVNGRRIGAEAVALSHGDIILLGARLSAAYLAQPDEQAGLSIGASSIMAATDEPETSVLAAMPSTASEAEPIADRDEYLSNGSEYDPPQWEATDMSDMSDTPPSAYAFESATVTPARAERAEALHPGPLPAMPPPQKNRNGRIMMIAAGCLLALLACCCSSTLFMYFIGGDWLLNQLGYLP